MDANYSDIVNKLAHTTPSRVRKFTNDLGATKDHTAEKVMALQLFQTENGIKPDLTSVPSKTLEKWKSACQDLQQHHRLSSGEQSQFIREVVTAISSEQNSRKTDLSDREKDLCERYTSVLEDFKKDNEWVPGNIATRIGQSEEGASLDYKTRLEIAELAITLRQQNIDPNTVKSRETPNFHSLNYRKIGQKDLQKMRAESNGKLTKLKKKLINISLNDLGLESKDVEKALQLKHLQSIQNPSLGQAYKRRRLTNDLQAHPQKELLDAMAIAANLETDFSSDDGIAQLKREGETEAFADKLSEYKAKKEELPGALRNCEDYLETFGLDTAAVETYVVHTAQGREPDTLSEKKVAFILNHISENTELAQQLNTLKAAPSLDEFAQTWNTLGDFQGMKDVFKDQVADTLVRLTSTDLAASEYSVESINSTSSLLEGIAGKEIASKTLEIVLSSPDMPVGKLESISSDYSGAKPAIKSLAKARLKEIRKEHGEAMQGVRTTLFAITEPSQLNQAKEMLETRFPELKDYISEQHQERVALLATTASSKERANARKGIRADNAALMKHAENSGEDLTQFYGRSHFFIIKHLRVRDSNNLKQMNAFKSQLKANREQGYDAKAKYETALQDISEQDRLPLMASMFRAACFVYFETDPKPGFDPSAELNALQHLVDLVGELNTDEADRAAYVMNLALGQIRSKETNMLNDEVTARIDHLFTQVFQENQTEVPWTFNQGTQQGLELRAKRNVSESVKEDISKELSNFGVEIPGKVQIAGGKYRDPIYFKYEKQRNRLKGTTGMQLQALQHWLSGVDNPKTSHLDFMDGNHLYRIKF